MKKRYFIWAAIFLFNPVVSVFDVFPDFIGYLLLMRAFSEASYVYDNAGETKEAFRQMALITLFKFISMIIVPFTDATMALVFSFSFSVIEIVFGLGAYQKLFDSISFICMRCGEDRYVATSERLKKFTIFFFFTRVVCSTVPDFCALFLSNPQKEWMFRFRTVFFFIFTIFAAIIALVWLIRIICFFKRTLTDAVKEKISLDFVEEMKDRQSVFFSKDFIFSIGIMAIAMLFNVDFYIDGIEFLSDILLAPLFAIGFFFLVKKGYIKVQKHEKWLIASLGVHFVSSVLNTIFTMTFNKNHYIESAFRNPQAQLAYTPVIIATVFEALSFVGIAILGLYLINKYAIDKVYENPRFFSEYSVEGYVKEFRKTTKKRFVFSVIFTAISAHWSVMYAFFRPSDETISVTTVLWAIIFFVTYMYSTSYAKEEVFKRIYKYS